MVGKSDRVATHNPHAFAYDLGASVPRMSDLMPAFAEGAEGIAVSGNVVAPSQRIPGSELTRAVAWRLSTTTAPALRFTKTKSFVRENAGHVTIKVVRDGGRAPRVRVSCSTRGIVARAGRDFTPTAGTLIFASGQTTASFRIPILNDKRREDREKFLIRLRDPAQAQSRGRLEPPRSSSGPATAEPMCMWGPTERCGKQRPPKPRTGARVSPALSTRIRDEPVLRSVTSDDRAPPAAHGVRRSPQLTVKASNSATLAHEHPEVLHGRIATVGSAQRQM